MKQLSIFFFLLSLLSFELLAAEPVYRAQKVYIPAVSAILQDAALMAAGIPPNIPNLDQLMAGDADFLAAQIAEQGGLPLGSVSQEIAREKLKNAILQGAQAARRPFTGGGHITKRGRPFESMSAPLTRQQGKIKPYNSVVYHIVCKFRLK